MDVRAGILLYWLHIICAGVFADVWKVHVESEMEALVSSCVVLPCSFTYPGQEQPSDRIRAMWHKKDNWGDIIFHKDPTRVKDSFKGHTKLIGSLGGSNCSLEIDEVRNHDNGPYCFRVELETSEKDKYSFVENCVSIKMIEKASKPKLQAEQSVQEGETAVFKCSVRHTCPSHQPTLTWSHTGKAIMSYKDIGHGNWETESVLTFIPQKEDDHTSIACTVKHHGKVEGEMTVTHSIFVKGSVLQISNPEMTMECGVDYQECLAGFVQVTPAVVLVADSRGGLFGVDFQGEVKGIKLTGILTTRQTTYVQCQETSLSPKLECHHQRVRPNHILIPITMMITPTQQTSTYMEISDENATF